MIDDPELGHRLQPGRARRAAVHPHPADPRRRRADGRRSRVDTIRSAGGHDMITSRSEVATVDGEHVATACPPSSCGARTTDGRRRVRRRRGRHRAARRRPSRSRRADLVRYAGASGDFNVIHWNERVATSVGLPDVIAHGMFTMALAGRVVTDWVGDPGAVLEYGVRFTRPVPVPDDDAGRHRRGHRQGRRQARRQHGPGRPHRDARRGQGARPGPGSRRSWR